MTLLLTLFAFKWSIANSLPPTPYLTLTDLLFNSAYLLCAIHIMGLCVVNQISYSSSSHQSIINWIIAIITFIIFLVIHIILSFRAKYYISLYPKEEINYDNAGHDALAVIAKSALNSPSIKTSRNNSFVSKTEANEEFDLVHQIKVEM